jgi:ABC-type multidrug transport system permease subunit
MHCAQICFALLEHATAPNQGPRRIIATSIAPEQETAMMMMTLLQFPMMFLSGILFPIDQLPNWLQWVGKMLPLYGFYL